MLRSLIPLLLSNMFLAFTSIGQELDKIPVIFKNKNWSVRAWVDPMTDKKLCTGFYKDRFDVQLNDADLYVDLRGRGGVSGVVLRFNDEPARPLRLATDTEKRISSVNITGEEFETLLTSKRLRVRVLTVLDNTIDEDIDLSGLASAHKVITGPECK